MRLSEQTTFASMRDLIDGAGEHDCGAKSIRSADRFEDLLFGFACEGCASHFSVSLRIDQGSPRRWLEGLSEIERVAVNTPQGRGALAELCDRKRPGVGESLPALKDGARRKTIATFGSGREMIEWGRAHWCSAHKTIMPADATDGSCVGYVCAGCHTVMRVAADLATDGLAPRERGAMEDPFGRVCIAQYMIGDMPDHLMEPRREGGAD